MSKKLHVFIGFICHSFTLLLLAFIPFELSAQVSSYAFSQSNGTYTPLANPTNIITATGNSGAPSFDTYTAPIPFAGGFTFVFNGISYTSCNIVSNGYITFGATTSTLSTPISGAGANEGAISAWGRDLNGMFNVGGYTTELNYEQTGTAPNRVLTVEFKDIRAVYSSSTTAAYRMNFQIKLHETSNLIEIVYGPNGYAIGSTSAASTAQIGLRGATNADFNNRLNATTLNFDASTAGTANNSTQAFSSSAATPGMPVSGLTYTYTPGDCVAPGGLSTNTIGTSTANISWGVPNPAPSNGYEYYYNTAVTTPTASATPSGTTGAGVTSASLSLLSPGTTYYFWVRSACSGGTSSGWSTVGSFATNCLPVAGFSENFDSYATGNIVPACWKRFTMGAGTQTISSTSPASGTRNLYQYSSTTANATLVLLPDASNINAGTHRLRFQGRTSTAANPALIDVGYVTDNDDPFNSFITVSALSVANTTYGADYIINYPNTVPAGARLAIRNPGTSASAFYYDDLFWEQIPTCLQPSNPSTGTVTYNTAVINWTPSVSNPSNGYEYFYSTTNTAPTADSIPDGTVGAGVLTATISGLSPVTTYYVWVRANCGNGDISFWSNNVSFTTLCGPVTTIFEDFDAYATGSIVPDCWERLVLGSGSQTITSTSPASGTRNVYQSSSAPANASFVILPTMANMTAGTHWVRFKARTTSTTTPAVLDIGYMTDIADAATYNVISSFSIANTVYGAEYTAAIPTTVPAGARLAIRNPGTSASTVYWDDLYWEPAPSCVSPVGLSVSNVTPTTATLSWNAPPTAPANGYRYYINTTNTTPALDVTPTVSTSALIAPLNGLSPSTTYYVWVKSICSSSDSSAWSNSVPFTTTTENDLPANAILLTVGASCSTPYSNIGATDVAGEPYASCKGTGSYGSVWFKFVAPASGAVKVSNDITITGTPVMADSRNALFSATDSTDFATFSIIACDDDNGSVTGARSVFYATGLTPGETYYVLNANHATGGARGLFCITVEELNASMIATTGSCAAGQSLSSYSATYRGWLSVVSTDSKLIALIRQNAGNAITFTSAININSGAIRVDGNGKKYLNRNLSVTATSGTATDIDMRLFFLPAELAALQAAEPNTVMGNLNVSHVTGTSCVADNTGTAGSILTQTANSTGSDYNWIQVNTPGFSNFYINGSSEPLPVTLRIFEGKNEGNKNILNWTTSNEINFSHFELEKSADGIHFNKLVTLEARGAATNGKYDYKDEQPFKGQNFYRLKVVDKNGLFIYSKVVMLTVKGNGNKVLAFPNPSHDYIIVQSTDASVALITLTDATGKVVRNIETNSGTTKLDLNGLASGFYTLRYQSDSFVEMIKIMKQ